VLEEALLGSRGFAVYTQFARVGDVERLCHDDEGRVRALIVRAGLLGSWQLVVPVDQVEDVARAERRIRLRTGGLLAPRRERGDTRAA
jgi:hypothetical protein